MIPLSFSSAFGVVEDFATNKSVYYMDDQLSISGNVSYDSEIPFVTIQIFTPGKSNFADFNTVLVNSDGSFSAIFHVGGPTWTSDGSYSVKVTYDGSMEKSIEYTKLSTTPSESNPKPSTASSLNPKPSTEPSSSTEPLVESTFTTFKLQIPNFPSLDKSPQYYIDRYNTESSYKSWFDSQFPDASIYNILGYGDPVIMPDWIQSNAGWWATGAITDSTFVTGIEFMIENNIIMISTIPSESISGDEIPNWVRNNAQWWSQDLISEDEFVNSLKFLIQEGIIVIT